MAIHVYDDTLFRTQFPAFASETEYPSALIEGYFGMAACYVDANDYGRLSGACLQLALNLLTAHLVAINRASPADGGGTGTVAASSIDKVSVTLQIPEARGPFLGWLSRTGFGQQLAALLRIKSSGGGYVGGNPERAAFRRVS